MSANAAAWRHTSQDWPTYRGIQCQQFPSDMARYADLIAELEPAFVVEVGRAFGGTALFLADELAKVNPAGRVVSIDPVPVTGLEHRLLDLVVASSTDEAAITAVARASIAASGRRGLILLDGNHSPATVADELYIYPRWADYLIVEDTIMRELPELFGDGPHVALKPFLEAHGEEWTVDPDPVPTQHPGGYLRRR
jgi:cephalosporin hydroxylase